MALRTILDTLEELDEPLRALYIKNDETGKYVLEIEGIDDHPVVHALKNAYNQEKLKRVQDHTRTVEVEERLKSFPEDFDPEKWVTYKAADEAGLLDDPEVDPRSDPRGTPSDAQKTRAMMQARLDNQKRDHEKKVGDLSQELEKKNVVINRLVVEDGLTKALVESNVDKRFLKAAKALLRPLVKIQEDGEDFIPVVEVDGDNIQLSKYVGDWIETDEGKPFIAPASGTGAPGGGRPEAQIRNPWMKEHHNLTEQGRILRENPQLAERLSKEAGIKIVPAA